jgi:hypothetical protein
VEKHTDTKLLAGVDPTLNPAWQAEQMDRLLGFEILTRTLSACYQPMAPELLADKVGANKSFSNKIIVGLQRKLCPKE